jgi:uncharacterized membrane protein
LIRTKRRSRVVASAAVFAAVYAVLGLIPVSAYVGISSFLSFREILAPLAGLLFGPLTGGLSMVLGGFLDIALRGSTNFDFLDFVPDAVAAVTAGLCFTGRRREALALPLLLTLVFLLDPLSATFVNVSGVAVPFVWMHLVSFAALGVVLLLERSGRLGRMSVAFIAVTVFASTMAAHMAGNILYENIYVRVNHVFTAQALQANWVLIFSLYPVERVFFTVAGVIVAVPVLRALSRREAPARAGELSPAPSA